MHLYCISNKAGGLWRERTSKLMWQRPRYPDVESLAWVKLQKAIVSISMHYTDRSFYYFVSFIIITLPGQCSSLQFSSVSLILRLNCHFVSLHPSIIWITEQIRGVGGDSGLKSGYCYTGFLWGKNSSFQAQAEITLVTCQSQRRHYTTVQRLTGSPCDK